LILSILLERQF